MKYCNYTDSTLKAYLKKCSNLDTELCTETIPATSLKEPKVWGKVKLLSYFPLMDLAFDDIHMVPPFRVSFRGLKKFRGKINLILVMFSHGNIQRSVKMVMFNRPGNKAVSMLSYICNL